FQQYHTQGNVFKNTFSPGPRGQIPFQGPSLETAIDLLELLTRSKLGPYSGILGHKLYLALVAGDFKGSAPVLYVESGSQYPNNSLWSGHLKAIAPYHLKKCLSPNQIDLFVHGPEEPGTLDLGVRIEVYLGPIGQGNGQLLPGQGIIVYLIEEKGKGKQYQDARGHPIMPRPEANDTGLSGGIDLPLDPFPKGIAGKGGFQEAVHPLDDLHIIPIAFGFFQALSVPWGYFPGEPTGQYGIIFFLQHRLCLYVMTVQGPFTHPPKYF